MREGQKKSLETDADTDSKRQRQTDRQSRLPHTLKITSNQAVLASPSERGGALASR